METSKIELERRTDVALMAHQARATRLLREMGEDSTPVLAAESSRPKLRALAALMSEIAKSSDTENTDDSAKPQPVKRSPEKSEELIDELRCNMAKSREEADDVKSNTGKQPIPQDAGRNSPRRIDRKDSLPFRRDPL